jgi:putative hemolysin
MKHRTDIVWLDIDEPVEDILQKVTSSAHSRFPVARESLDNVHGVVRAKDLLSRHLSAEPIELKTMLQPPLFVPENMPALQVLERFKESRSHIALVIDEYGGVQGLVTTYDVLEAIVGDIPLKGEIFEPEVVQRQDGSWLLDGILPIDEFKEIFDIKALPGEYEGHFETLGGFVMKFLGRIPTAADAFTWRGIRFEVVDMDGLRVDKVLVVPASKLSDD